MSAIEDDDIFVLTMLSPFLLPVAAGVLMSWWDGGREWALDHNIVADADEAIVGIPGWDGAGLGGVHVVVGASLLVLFLILGSVFARRRRGNNELPESPF